MFERTITSERAEDIDYAGTRRGKDNVIRVARCMIPDNDQVYDLVQEFLSKYGKHSWLADVVNDMSAKKASDGEWVFECTLWETEAVYIIDPNGDGDWYSVPTDECAEGYWTYVEDDDNTGGGDPSGGDESFPLDCENDVTTPCPPGGGGSPPGCPEGTVENGDGGCVAEDPCEGDAPPVYCEDPCETNDQYIDSLSQQNVLNTLWQESFGEDEPLPQDERKELGGWIIEDSNGIITFVSFPSNLESSICTINNVPPPPQDAVGVIHTHPIASTTESIKVASCINKVLENFGITDSTYIDYVLQEGVVYKGRASEDDLKYSEHYSLDSYFIDGEQIQKFYDGNTNQQIQENHDRCGF